MRFETLVRRLERLPSPLPAPPAGLDPVILTAGRQPPWLREAMARPPRDAAALVLLYPGPGDEAHLVLTVRPIDDHVHAGQVALPGGKREVGDVFPEGTALREAAEEVGLDATEAGVRTLGVLETVDVRVSGFLMVPVLALADRQPQLTPDAREVAELLSVPVRHFLPDAPVEVVEEDRDGWRLRYAAYPVAGHRVWGATGRALGQLGAALAAAEMMRSGPRG